MSVDSQEGSPNLDPKDRYISTVYDEKERPVTAYPGQLAAYLSKRFGLKPGQSLLEAGCGRGDFLKEFAARGIKCFGSDLSNEVKVFLPNIDVKVGNIETDGLPYPDRSMDVVYSKSLLEHLQDPARYLKEAWRVLKPGGLCITMVPDWESNYKIYFDDYTHRTPFTTVSLADIYRICGFNDIEVMRFRQLPVTWKYPALNYFCGAISPFIPVRTTNKFLRWSRELMLLGAARKPKDSK